MSSLGEECCTPAPLSLQTTSGKVENWNGLDVYVNGPDSAKAAVILVTDVFGYEVPQFRRIVDLLGAKGYLAVGPDLLHGDLLPNLSSFPQWIQKHPPAGKVQEVKKAVEYVKEKGVTSIGLVGFCWGAKVAVLTAAQGQANAVLFFHPSMVTVEDVKNAKVPIAVLGAEIDKTTPPSLVEEFKKALEADPEVGPKSVFKVYPGTTHGYSVKYDPEDEKAVKNANNAYSDMLNFLESNL